MTEKLSKELGEFCRLYDELKNARNSIRKMVSDILEEEINPLKFNCDIRPEILHLEGEETSQCIEVRVPIQDSSINLSILNSIKEKVGAVNVSVHARIEEEFFEQNENALIELRIFLPLLLPFQ